MSSQFETAVEIVNSLPPTGAVKPTQDDQLKFYSLYKQATVGDVNTDRPGAFDFKGKYKWDAWKSVEGKSSDHAKAEYVAALRAMLEKAGDDADAKAALAKLDAAA